MTEIRAKVTKEFDGVEDGTVYPRLITVNEEISGSLAVTAIAAGNAKETKESRSERLAGEDAAAAAERAKQEAEEAEKAAEAKRQEDIAKLALLSKEQIAELAVAHKIDIAGLRSEEDVIDAMQRGFAANGIDIPGPIDKAVA